MSYYMAVMNMVLNALDRDAADGKVARGEMAAELRAVLAQEAWPVVERRNAELEAVDQSKENKMFEAWAKTQSSVSLRLCDIGLYLSRETGLAHDAWQARSCLDNVKELNQ